MQKPKMTGIKLNAHQAVQADVLDPKDGSEFVVLGQVFVGDHPQAGMLYCYQFNRAQYDIVAKAIIQAFEIKKAAVGQL